jgi:Transposase
VRALPELPDPHSDRRSLSFLGSVGALGTPGEALASPSGWPKERLRHQVLITVLSAGSVEARRRLPPIDGKERHDEYDQHCAAHQQKTRTRTDRVIYAGVDTHKELHVAAVVDDGERVLGTRSFSTTRAGYRALLAWIGEFGEIARVGVEGTGSYGAGLTRHLASAGVSILEVDRPDRSDRRRKAKTMTWTRSTPPGPRCTGTAPSSRSPNTARSRHCGCFG